MISVITYFCTFLQNYPASKLHWSGINLPVTLTVAPACLEQRDVTSNALLATYPYKDIACLKKVVGCPGCHGSSEAWAIEMKQTGRMVIICAVT